MKGSLRLPDTSSRVESGGRIYPGRRAAALLLGIVVCVEGANLSSCSRTPSLPVLSSADSLKVVQDNMEHRAEVDSFFRSDPGSPFLRDTAARYHGINWYPIDPRFCAHSTLHRYADPDTVVVMGTRGEERRELRYGYFEFAVPDDHGLPVPVKINVYKFTPYDGQRYLLYKDNLSVWFTDLTTGKETYHVGRYVEVGVEHSSPSHVYTIDLNKAYNPYCAYSDKYSCAIPRQEDRLNVALPVGEKTYREF